jgi:hypothetical protein
MTASAESPRSLVDTNVVVNAPLGDTDHGNDPVL